MGNSANKELGFEKTQALQEKLARVLNSHRSKVVDDLSTILDPGKYSEGLYLSGMTAAVNGQRLNQAGVTRVLNVCGVKTEDDLRKTGFKGEILVLNISDNEDFPIDKYFDEAFAFLRAPIEKPGPAGYPRTLVHCQLGISRSPTVVIAYLMQYHNMNLWQAAEFTVKCRGIVYPNEGFLEALVLFAHHHKKL